MRKVGFPNNIFEKSLGDYSDWKTAWVREIVQNSVDAGSTEVEIDIDETEGTVICRDNGVGMDEHVLYDVFLCLGESYKEAGSVGGFGRAKEILLFAHPRWEIITKKQGNGILAVSGSFIEYDDFDAECGVISDIAGHGTNVSVKMDDISGMEWRAKEYLRTCQTVGCRITVNGEEIGGMRKGKTRQDLGWASVYANGSSNHSNRLFVRKNGVVMYEEWFNIDTTLILEIEVDSTEVMTTNRDGLKGEYKKQLSDLIFQQYKKKYEESERNKDEKNLVLAFGGTGYPPMLVTGSTGGTASVKYTNSPADYGIPFVFRFDPKKDANFSWQNEKVRKIGSAWLQITEMMENNLREADYISEDLGIMSGFTLANDAIAELVTIGSCSMPLINPRYYLSKSAVSVAYRMVEDAVHEFAHILEVGHNNDFVKQMNGIKDVIFKNGGAERYYSVAQNFVDNEIELIGSPQVEQEQEISNVLVQQIDAMMEGYEKKITKKRIAYKIKGNRNILTILRDTEEIVFNMLTYEDMSEIDLVTEEKRDSHYPVVEFNGWNDITRIEILEIIDEYLRNVDEERS